MCGGQGGGGLEVIVHVQHVGQEGLGGRIDLLHLVLHLNRLQGEFLPRTRHPEQPGDPLEEDDPDLRTNSQRRRETLQLLYPMESGRY